MQGERGCLRDLQRYHRAAPQQPALIEEDAHVPDTVDTEEQNATRYFGTFEQNLPLPILKVLFGHSGRSGRPRGRCRLVRVLRHNRRLG